MNLSLFCLFKFSKRQPVKKKAVIFDLDNTIFPVSSIGDKLFAPLFELIKEDGHHDSDFEKIRDEIMRKPFQKIAEEHKFRDELTGKCTEVLKNLSYNDPIEPYPDYHFVRSLPVDKFLVTAGFLKMQQSKIKGLGIEKDFKEIQILDLSVSGTQKIDVFKDFIKRYDFEKSEIIVIGDDPDSEIRSARDLGLDSVLYDHDFRTPSGVFSPIISDYHQLPEYL
jgi:putative hydrolase of the HAD superfamily